MAGLADIRIIPVKDDAATTEAPREIVIPASIDKYRKPAEVKPEKKGISLSDYMPGFLKGDKAPPKDTDPVTPPEPAQATQGVTDPMGIGLGQQIMDVAAPTRTSVLEGQQIPLLPFDPQEAEPLSNRAYAEATPAPGDVNDPRLRAPSLSQSNPRPEDPNTAKGLGYADSSFPVRVGAKAVAGIAEGVGGVMRSAGDITGINALKAAGQSTADGAKAFEQGMGDIKRVDGFGPKSPVPYLANMAEGAASSLAQTAALGSMFGAHAVIPMMSIQSAGTQYNAARNAGKSPAEALANAVPYGIFEAVGEKFTGLDRVAGAMGTLLQKGVTAEAKKTAAETLIKSGIKEVPGEIITYLGQTGVDLLPGIGLNPKLTMGQFLDGLRDTVVQASMMGGAMGVGGAAVQRKQRDAAELAGMNATLRSIAPDLGLPDKAVAAALEKTKGMEPDKVPGFLDRFTQSLATKGLLKPHAPGTVDKALRDARHQAGTAIDALQAKPQADEAVPASEVLGAIEPDQKETPASPANQKLEEAAHSAATSPLNDIPEPTQAQKDAGNYPMGHTRIGGMGVTIENPAGSTRKGAGPDGKPWESHMHDHYGYFKRTEGADGDKLDGFFKIGTPEDFAGNVYVVDQIDPKTGKFDEHKVVVGSDSEADAKATYLRNYEPGWQGMGAMTSMPMAEFKAWVKDGIKNKPLGQIKGAPDVGAGAQANPVDTGTGGQLGDNAAGGDTVRGRVPDNAAQRGTDAAGTVLADGQQDAPVRTGEPKQLGALKIGTTPKNAEEVSIKDGVVHIGKYPAVDFESGEPVQLAEGASHAQIRDALKAAKALGAHQKLFGLVDDVQNAAPGTPAAQAQAAAVEAPADAGTAASAEAVPAATGGSAPVEATGVAERKPARGSHLRTAANDKNPLIAFIAQHGLFHEKGKPNSLKAEFSPDKAIMVPGYPPVFRKTGQNLDLLTHRAIEDGFLPKDGTEQQLYALIQRAIGGERIAPLHAEGVADDVGQKEMEARLKLEEADWDTLREQDAQWTEEFDDERAAIEAESDLPDIAFIALDDAVPWGVNSNADNETFLKALGLTDQEIKDAIAEESRVATKNRQGSTRPEETPASQAPGDHGQRGQAPGGSPRNTEAVSTPQTPADAGVSVSGVSIEPRADGTLAVSGPVAEIKAKLKAAGIPDKSVMSGKGKVIVGKTQADKAKAALQQVRAMDADGRPLDKKPINAGDTFTTASGRTTSGYPKQKGEKYASQWLIDNATDEAESRGDKFNAPMFKAEKPGRDGGLTPASRDSMLEYLFGEQPAVAPSILKPLAPSSTHKVGDMVKLTKPNPTGGKRINIAGRIRKILPDGRLEILTQQDGYFTLKESELGHRVDEVLQAPTPAEVIAQQERKDNAQALDDKAQIDAEAQLQTLTMQTAPDQRQDTTADIFGGPTVEDVQRAKAEKLAKQAKDSGPGLFDAPAATPDPLTEAEKAAKAKMLNAAGKLAHLLSKNTRMNITPEQEQAMLPIVIELFDGAMELGYVKFKQAARYVREFIAKAIDQDAADSIPIDTLQGAYIATARRYTDKDITPKKDVIAVDTIAELAEDADNSPKETPDVPSPNTRVERNSGQPATEPAVGEPVPAEPGRLDQGTGQAGKDLGAEGRGRDGDTGVSVDSAVAGGERGGVYVHRGNESVGSQGGDAGDLFGERGGDSGNDGIQAESVSTSAVDKAAKAGLGRSVQPSSVKVEPGLESIQATVPQLLPQQQEDVLKAETRFAKPDGYGMLFTNGTGTGKTYSGLGIIKRFALQGKTNTLIAVPDDKIAADWIKSGRNLGLGITKLADTKSAGTGIVITSYANLGANDELAKRKWDLVVADEAHSLMQSANGESTSYLANLRAITHHPDGSYQLHAMRNRDDLEKTREISDQITQNEKIRNHDDTMDVMRDSLAAENDALNKRLSALRKKLDARLEADKKEVADMQGEKRTRAVFLSATPFAYEKTLDWANGYLFDYKAGYPYTETSLGYNDPTPREHFFMQHLGYRKRYGKLTEPEGAKVDRGLMQRQLNGWLKKEGSLSGRMLDVPADYDRRFVLVDSAIGNQIDEALQWLGEQSRSAPKDDGGFSALRAAIEDKFDYLSRRYLLEAIKATEAIPIVKAHMAMGRKVVVFHDYKKGGGFNPFNVQPSRVKDGSDEDSAKRAKQFNAALAAFQAKFTDLVNHPFHQMGSPIDVFSKAFDDVLLINGDEKKADLLKRYEEFQDDASGPKVMLVQSAKNKGWSGHDTTGKHQRVLINLGQPTAPTLAIQQEGRIYRTGQVSNAIMRYLNTGTNWEKWAFASTIAGRASTAENLGMGELSRALKDSFINAFEESDAYPPGHEGEGTGGKERDEANNAVITEWDRAKTFYWATGKKTSKTKAQEGTDYFATPEPVGLKMVEWADLRGAEDALEPSGGHGAIARWMPETTTRTVIEPSMALRSRLAMVMNDGAHKIIDGTFEGHNIVNKYDGIVMNPPFGVGGKTAMEHVAKAATHLRDGGRIVALIPTGPAADKRFEKWFYETSEKPVQPLLVHPTHGPIYKGDTLKMGGFGKNFDIVVDRISGQGDGPFFAVGKGEYSGINMTAANSVGSTGKRTEEFKPAADLYLVADIKLPQVTFERAGTAVATRIVVIEKHAKESEAPQRSAARMDLSNAADINELFDLLENVSLPSRTKAEVVAEPAKAEKPAKAPKETAPSANVGDTVTLMGKPYEVSIYTTNAGKELRGAWVPTKAIALFHGKSTFQVRGKGFFVRERDFPKGDASDFDSSVAARDSGLLSQYTPEEAKVKQEREAKALKDEQTNPKAPPARKVTADQVDLFNPQGALFARQAPSAGMSIDGARAVVDAITAKWKNAPTVRVVKSFRDLPQETNPPADARGLYYRGTIWIVAGANKDPAMVARTYAHEAIAHHGLREILGREDWRRFMGQIKLAIASGNKPLNEISKDIRRLYVDENGRFNLSEGLEADEIAARVVENAIDQATGHFRPGYGFVKEVYAKLAKWLREVVGINVPFTMAELQGMLVAAQSGLKTGNRTAGGGQMVVAAARDESPMASRSPNFNSAVDSVIEGAANGKELGRGHIDIGDPSPALQLAGIENHPLRTTAGNIAKAHFDHGVTKSVLKEIPDLLDHPVMVFDSDTVTGSFVVVTSKFVNGNPLVVIITPQKTRGSVSFNFVPSLYPKDHIPAISKWIKSGLLRGADKKQSPQWFVSARLQLPGEIRTTKGLQDANVSVGTGIVKLNNSAIDDSDVPMAARAPGAGTLRPSTAPMDTVLRTFGGNLAARITSPTYAWLARAIDAMTPEVVKAGVVSDYGLKDDYLDRKQEMKTAQRQHARNLSDVVDGLQNLDRQQSRVAYFWMQEHPDNKAEADMLAQLPAESRATLLALKEQIDTLGQEAVKLGMISAETIERNRMAYLHRSYKRYETEDSGKVKATRGRAIKILGDQFKGRGLRDNADMAKIAELDWYKRKTQDGKSDTSLKGQMFHRLERRSLPDTTTPDMVGNREAKLGKLREVVYWPVEEAIPRHLADWRNDGRWEARFFDKSGKVGMWRDFTLAERTAMGEIQEVRYGVAKTIMQMSRDVETARFLDWIAKNEAKQDESMLPPDAIALETASTSLMRAYLKNEWVQVPSAAIPGTAGLKRYGNLAGRWVPGPVWNDLRQIASISDQDVISKVYGPILRAWKISKTALSPATHMNNVMSNFIMADAHDVQAKHMLAALRAVVQGKKNPVATALIEAFQDNGGDAGMFNAEEIKNEIFEPLLKQLEGDLKTEAGTPSALMMASNVFALLKAKEIRQAVAMIGQTQTAKVAGIPFKRLIKLYGQEDELFRLAAFIKAREDGLNDHDAGKFARESFLNYEINAPWIAALRKSWMPFVAFTYRAAPMMAKTAADKPWKIAKWMMVAGALNALGYMMSGGDEDKERAFMPDEKNGRIWGLVPKLIRMPWNDAYGQPVFLDIRRWVPVGDVVDMGQSHSAVPIPPPLMPGGPGVILGELIGNTSLFTGQDITKDTDNLADQWSKAGDYLWKSVMPNLPIPNPVGYLVDSSGQALQTYSWSAISGAGKGKTDAFSREQSVPQALSSSIGVKVGSYPGDVLERNATTKFKSEHGELIRGLKADGRALMKKGIDQEEFDDRKAATLEKLTKRTAEFEGKRRKSLGLADQR